uniref:Iron-sulfur cluster-binding protein n=1 Tax=uncultured organism TaxID=155900 RepID=M1QAJ4_9ZZZZ|nr:iron-sulfur cluster-binding protein [uncultured organism]
MQVFIGRCIDYSELKESLERGLDTLGGLDSFVESGETILLKPNLLRGSSPEKAVVTHPDFIIGITEMLEDLGVNVIVGDSPGGPMSENGLKKAYRKANWTKIPQVTNATLNYNVEKVEKKIPDGRVKKSFPILEVMDEVDGIINLPKLKTHTLTVFTGAVKNNYGMVHGLTKSALHGQMTRLNKFSKMLLDVKDVVKPRLSIMDAVWGMEGSGPSRGDPIKLDLVLASEDPVALDIGACRSVGIPLQKVPTITESDIDPESVEYTQLNPGAVDEQIDYPKGGSTPWWAPDFLAGFLSNFLMKRPEVDRDRCVYCGECEEMCPEDAITIKKNGPKISWFKCCRCYCCTETCPKEALKVD